LIGKLKNVSSSEKVFKAMITSDGIRRNGFQSGIAVWEEGSYLGEVKALEFEEVRLKNNKAKVGFPKMTKSRKGFVLTFLRRRVVPRFGLRILAEITVPEAHELCLWELNITQSKRARRLVFFIRARREKELLFYDVFRTSAYFRRGEPLLKTGRKEKWIAEFCMARTR